MKNAYRTWFADVSATRGYPVPRIVVGTKNENPVTLTRQDWRGPQAGWRNDGLGHWEVEVAQAGLYDITVRTPAEQTARTVRLRIGQIDETQPLAAQADRAKFESVRLEPGQYRVEASVERGQGRAGAHYVDLLALEGPATDR